MKDDLMAEDDLNAIKGILFAMLFSLPLWVAAILLLMLFGVFG
jgi:hypothetical protein